MFLPLAEALELLTMVRRPLPEFMSIWAVIDDRWPLPTEALEPAALKLPRSKTRIFFLSSFVMSYAVRSSVIVTFIIFWLLLVEAPFEMDLARTGYSATLTVSLG